MMLGVIGPMELVTGFFGLLATAFWIWMLVDAAMNEAETGPKIAWVLIILFAYCLGALAYFFIRKLPRQKSGIF